MHSDCGGDVVKTAVDISNDALELVEDDLVAVENADESLADEDAGKEVLFDEQVACVIACVNNHPSRRELMYKTLMWFDDQVHEECEVEQTIEAFPEFSGCLQNSHTILRLLANAGGVDHFPVDFEGNELNGAEVEQLPDDEYFELVEGYRVRITLAGKEASRRMSPDKRMDDLFASHPLQVGGYREVLDFLVEQPHTRYEIEAFCEGKPYLKAPSNVSLPFMRPSHFIDKLERAGMIEWNNGKWTASAAGRLFAQAMLAKGV